MITVTAEEYKAYNPTGSATPVDLHNSAAVVYSYTNYTEPTDADDIKAVKDAICMFADYELDNGITTGVAQNDLKSVSVDGMSYSMGGSKVSDISKAKMPVHINAILAPTGLLYRGMC